MKSKAVKKRGHLVTKVLLVAVALATLIGLVLMFIGVSEISTAYGSMTERMLHASEYQMKEMFTYL